MAIEVFSNFVNTTLAGTIGPSATSFTVASGTGATLPQPAAGQFGRLIFTDQLTGNVHEIITYTSVSGDTVSGVTRGASPLTWAAGDIILCGPTAQTMAEFVQAGQAQSNATTYAPDTGSANAYAIAPSPAIVGTPNPGTRLYFKALAANTGASTLSVNGTSYTLTGANGALAANEIVANGNVEAVWNSTYSGFELVSCTRAEVAVPTATVAGHAINLGQANSLYAPINATGAAVAGTVSNPRITCLGVNNYNCVVTADEIILENSTNAYYTARAVNLTINANGTVGAPLSVAQARTASTWLYVWLWYNATLGLTATLDTSSSAPTAPTGYLSTNYKTRFRGGEVRTDSSGSTYLLQTISRNGFVQYVRTTGSNVPLLPSMASGTATAAAIAVGAFIPPTATTIHLVLGYITVGTYAGVAPNTSYTAPAADDAPPISGSAPSGSGSVYGYTNGDFVLESTNIYYWAGGGTTMLRCLGWS